MLYREVNVYFNAFGLLGEAVVVVDVVEGEFWSAYQFSARFDAPRSVVFAEVATTSGPLDRI